MLGDTFNYSITNSLGISDEGQVTITVVGENDEVSTSMELVPDGANNILLTLYGIPSREVVIEAAPDLVSSWTAISTNTFSASGRTEFLDTNVPDTRFYRMRTFQGD